MHLNGRRVSALSVVALTSLTLGLGNIAASDATAARPSSTQAKSVYHQLTQPKAKKKYIKLDLLALNDFHGNLETVPSTSSSGRINNTPAGGAAYLARLIRHERTVSRDNGAKPITVAAGDLIGASPLLSAAFHDEPTIKFMNQIGLQVASVGNHEFDEGYRELRRMQRGGCLADGPDGANGQNSCPGDQGFDGADFQYLSANVKWADRAGHSRDTLFPSTKIMKVRGVKVAFIGMTLEGTPAIVSQAGIQGLDFTDEVETANALVPKLRKKGVKSIVVLLHEGVTPADTTAYNDCTGPAGPALEIAQKLSPAIDAIVSGHTHQPYNCVVADPKGQPRLLTSAASFGRMVTKLHLLIDPATRDIVRPAEYAHNMIVENDASVAPSQDVLDLIGVYKTLVEPIANKVIGHIDPGSQIVKTADSNGGDSPLGNLIADGQKADDSVVTAGGVKPVIALMNPGGIRADLVENSNGDVTYGGAFSVQPFNNFVVSMDLTGAQIRALLNQQWNGPNEGTGQKILQVSGLSYTWDVSEAGAPSTDALVGTVLVDADGDPATAQVPLDDAATYRVVANNFLSDGGDNFTTFKDGTNKLVGGLDIDSLRKFLLAHDPVSPTATDRISQTP
ncbi:bifunctional metallophosphatase/5'-nucleotidase [Nocardioides sp. KIGAM211]|uniref:Bifunctional metallophosphatase/5'-nucleotidase n=1 Tax=Nocardioides luti TaxID=2761101 RepID=A0A7X0REB6_9ACTN|nr:bifunctional metallophosphatase/5'-nucleotidase [Nocardioides luti]MBB6625730.1 bifunctional metallophosphatase/5'-nucleotidase [Nocardioides luti]